jgi:hypothetical protein
LTAARPVPVLYGMLLDHVSKLGRIVEEQRADGVRVRLDFGQRNGRRLRLDSLPAADGSRVLLTRDSAPQVLLAIRHEVAQGKDLAATLARFSGRTAHEHLVDALLREYVSNFTQRVEQGRRSPNTLREIERYVAGPFQWWKGKPVEAITTANVEAWTLYLGTLKRPDEKPLKPKSVRNMRDHFRAFVRWLHRRGALATLPHFEVIEVPEYEGDSLTWSEVERVLAAIEWEKRGVFLACATESLRISEARALTVQDYREGRLRAARAAQGMNLSARVKHTKNRTAEWRELWHPDLIRWCEERLATVSPEDRLRGDAPLFTNPKARNKAGAWPVTTAEREWTRACERAGVRRIPLQQGTRHSALTALGEALPERVLRAYSRHRDARSLDHYSKPRPKPEAILRALRPDLDPGAAETRPGSRAASASARDKGGKMVEPSGIEPPTSALRTQRSPS